MGGAAGRKALIVDDEADLRLVLGEFLREEGWSVLEAGDGDDALWQAISKHPDVIILDVTMRDREDGFRVYRELRGDRRTEHIPVIFLTAVNELELGTPHTEATVAERFGVPEPEAFLSKPFDMGEVQAALARIFGE
ncbi:MAG: response regulator [Candidatus Hydrogenedentes bacterium]|nr:response regulator [Candidatus Hydrogenedentota bacterium]